MGNTFENKKSKLGELKSKFEEKSTKIFVGAFTMITLFGAPSISKAQTKTNNNDPKSNNIETVDSFEKKYDIVSKEIDSKHQKSMDDMEKQYQQSIKNMEKEYKKSTENMDKGLKDTYLNMDSVMANMDTGKFIEFHKNKIDLSKSSIAISSLNLEGKSQSYSLKVSDINNYSINYNRNLSDKEATAVKISKENLTKHLEAILGEKVNESIVNTIYLDAVAHNIIEKKIKEGNDFSKNPEVIGLNNKFINQFSQLGIVPENNDSRTISQTKNEDLKKAKPENNIKAKSGTCINEHYVRQLLLSKKENSNETFILDDVNLKNKNLKYDIIINSKSDYYISQGGKTSPEEKNRVDENKKKIAHYLYKNFETVNNETVNAFLNKTELYNHIKDASTKNPEILNVKNVKDFISETEFQFDAMGIKYDQKKDNKKGKTFVASPKISSPER